MLARLREWARLIKRDVVALYLAAGDPRVPWHAKALAACVAGYALSPIDLIPDFIPVLGYLDDLLLVPLGIWLVVSLVPPDVMSECRQRASESLQRPKSNVAVVAIVAVWVLVAALAVWASARFWFVRQ
jgi:uncharacterized membrane protein YkvA (DUF1232 family)